MAHILIVEDESAINHLIMKNLRLVSHTCEQVFEGTIQILANRSYIFGWRVSTALLPACCYVRSDAKMLA